MLHEIQTQIQIQKPVSVFKQGIWCATFLQPPWRGGHNRQPQPRVTNATCVRFLMVMRRLTAYIHGDAQTKHTSREPSVRQTRRASFK